MKVKELYKGVGLEYCQSPEFSSSTVSAVSISFALLGSSPFSVSACAGFDYYYQIGCWGGR